jgi:hypothetical protein
MGVIAIVAVSSVASVAIGAGPRSWIPPACAGGEGPGAAARVPGPASAADLAREAWFRMDPRLDRAGALVGQRLAIGLDGDRSSRIMDLPAESFAAGPIGRIVLVGTDDGATSRLRAIDVSGGCAWDVGTESDVIRRATIDPTGTTIYEMRVDRATRADLGIWSRPLDGSVPATPLLESISADERFGPTFTTEFAWELSGTALVVQSCGEAACRTRVVELASGSVQAVADPELGALVGVDGDRLVTYAACPGLPCAVVSTDLSTGARSILADAAAIAILATTADGPRLVHEVFAGPGIALRSVALDGSATRDLGPVPEGIRLHSSPAIAGSSTRIGSGWILLSPDGRLPDTGPNALTLLRHATDGTTVQLDEVAQ